MASGRIDSPVSTLLLSKERLTGHVLSHAQVLMLGTNSLKSDLSHQVSETFS